MKRTAKEDDRGNLSPGISAHLILDFEGVC